jgi:hypothetical protein
MSVLADDAGSEGGELTLVVTRTAAERLADPGAALAEAREWSQYVGVVGDDADRVAAFVAEHDIPQDYAQGERDKWLVAEEIREATATPRHVLVGASVEDRRIADYLDYEFRHVTDAAERADWPLADADDAGLIDRIRRLLPGN